MKLNWNDVITVLVAMAIWTLLDRLFLGDLLASIGNTFEAATR